MSASAETVEAEIDETVQDTVDSDEGGDAGVTGTAIAPEVVNRALQTGWVPKDQWKGDPDKWTDANEYVERGEQIMPILRANNKALSSQLSSTQQELASLRAQLNEMAEYNAQQTVQALKSRKTELRTTIETARKEGEVDQVVALEEELETVNAEITKVQTKKSVQQQQQADPNAARIEQEYAEWQSQNTWYNTDIPRTQLALGVAAGIRADPATKSLTGRAFLDKMVETMEQLTGGNSSARVARKVASTSPGGQGGGKADGDKSYNAMPAEAKTACARFERTLVGEGKKFKTVEAWRTKYAKDYWAANK